MVVVPAGWGDVGRRVTVEIISVIPSAEGKMGFARSVGSQGD
jgi:uncharacterized protein YacL